MRRAPSPRAHAGRLRRRVRLAPAHLDHDCVPRGAQVFVDVAYPLEVIEGDVIAHVLVRRHQHGPPLGRPDLKGPDPGIEIIRRKFAFQVGNAGFPVGLGHARGSLAGVVRFRVRNRAAGTARGTGAVKSNVLWITWPPRKGGAAKRLFTFGFDVTIPLFCQPDAAPMKPAGAVYPNSKDQTS